MEIRYRAPDRRDQALHLYGDAPRSLRACVEALARFAFYSGVGAGTARGFGQTRLLSARPVTAQPIASHAQAG